MRKKKIGEMHFGGTVQFRLKNQWRKSAPLVLMPV